jgi:hypothetical protein
VPDLDELRAKVLAMNNAAAKAQQKVAVATDKVDTALKALKDEFGVDEEHAAELEAQLEQELAAELAKVEELLEQAGA